MFIRYLKFSLGFGSLGTIKKKHLQADCIDLTKPPEHHMTNQYNSKRHFRMQGFLFFFFFNRNVLSTLKYAFRFEFNF